MLGEFRDFAMRGNMLDMAVGIIVGAAFGRVVSSFVSDSPYSASWAGGIWREPACCARDRLFSLLPLCIRPHGESRDKRPGT